LKKVLFKKFGPTEDRTWKALFARQSLKRDLQIVPQFSQGLKALGICAETIPHLENVNSRLRKLTGWEGVPVEGLEEGASFYDMLAQRKFPIGNFIRDEKDLSYTPAPDIFHDLYGHLPFFVDPQYAEFCQEYGRQASKYKNDPKILQEFERFFWFTIEFGLIETAEGRRIFGAGIASSYGECEYALSTRPIIKNFDVEAIRNQEFRIDIFQEQLFVLKSVDQLYGSLDIFVKAYKAAH
jgi:phenylalanine-4-hydroxylase